jgi:hypothetical protein
LQNTKENTPNPDIGKDREKWTKGINF